MDDTAIARALHVLAVVVWIGGVWMVTTIALPASTETAAIFEAIERRFTWHARIATLVAGASGFYMAWRLELWDRFASAQYWWMHAMVALWAIFTLILFVAEPLFLHRWFDERARRDPHGTLALARRFHWVLLALSLITVFGAVAGSHGLVF